MKYKLLKDLPGLKKGSIFIYDEESESYENEEGEYYFDQTQITDPEWFSPCNEILFEVDNWITLTKAPRYWSSRFNNNSPLQLSYPITVKIVKVDKENWTDGFYGFDIDTSKEVARTATKEEIAKVTARPEINGYKAEIINGKIQFGCQSFTKDDLKFLTKLISEPVNAKITINNTLIDLNLLNRLISLR